jgi:hypothetical protein
LQSYRTDQTFEKKTDRNVKKHGHQIEIQSWIKSSIDWIMCRKIHMCDAQWKYDILNENKWYILFKMAKEIGWLIVQSCKKKMWPATLV